MHIYRFKIRFEDQDEFLREIEIGSDQTFEDFFLFLVNNLKLNPATLSSFFLCDHRYRKKEEIFLEDMNPDDQGEEGKPPVKLMNACRLSHHIDDPHQKLLLIYDYLHYWTFYIDLIKIQAANDKHSYPRIHKAEGDTPTELTAKQDPAHFFSGEDPDFSFGEDDTYDPDDIDALREDDFAGDDESNLDEFDDDKLQ